MRRKTLKYLLFLSLSLVLTLAALAPVHAEVPVMPPGKIPLLDGTWALDSAKFSFAILGDKTSGGEGKWPIYDRAVDGINSLAPDFVITVGDQIDGHMKARALWDEEWAEYFEHARRIDAPLFLIPGNHDISNPECYRYWQEDFGRTYYSFDYKGCHFVVLNTEEERLDGRGPVWQAMMTWAEEDLAAHADSRHTFFFFHKPMWRDARYERDWPRLERAIAGRPCTIVAGHWHDLQAERRENQLYVVQSATGGGLGLCELKEYGCFHSFGYVTVDGDSVTYAVVEPEGGVWPVDIAPAKFKQAVQEDLVAFQAVASEKLEGDTAMVRTSFLLRNVLPEPATIEVQVHGIEESGWRQTGEEGLIWPLVEGALTQGCALAPGESRELPLTFAVPVDRLCNPPLVSHQVTYKGVPLGARSEDLRRKTVPLYPESALRIVPAWQLIGPFQLGPIDTSHLPDYPEKANPNFYKQFGPEEGYNAARVYDDGLKWFRAEAHSNGLLNFNALMGTQDNTLGYALCGMHSPVDQLVHATVCPDNYAQVLLNGALLEHPQHFGRTNGIIYIPLHLKAGWNTLTVKLINRIGDWDVQTYIADPMGNLTFADHPPEDE